MNLEPTEPKKKVLAIEDKDDFSQEVKKNTCNKAVAHARSVISLYEKYNGDFKNFPDYKSKKEMTEDVKELKEGNWGDCSQSEQATIKKAIKLYDENQNKKPEKKPSEKTTKNFKVERSERTRLINDLSQEMGKKFDPFKILGIKASEETPELVKSRCRELRLKEHPDKGGDKGKFDLIQKACDILLKTETLIVQGKAEKKNVPEGVSENVLKSLIKQLLDMITLKEIKKQKSKKDLEELFKTAVSYFNNIQKTFSNKYGFKTKKEQRAWFEDNGLSFDKYDTENNLLRRRVKEQLKKV